MVSKDPYAQLGVSSKKEGVHEATKTLSKGLYPGAFCKIVPLKGLPDQLSNGYAQVIHSDGVGTKSNVAYIARQEGYDTEIYRTLPQDALVMNTDDMACVGVVDNIYISNHIARNANRVSDEDVATIIKGYQDFYALAKSLGISIYDAGGETADVGSYTTTLGIDVTAVANIPKYDVIDAYDINADSYIVALASYGKSTYEKKYNSGIRSNGLTLAINSILGPKYRLYKEAMDGSIEESNLFTGKYQLDDIIKGNDIVPDMKAVEAILSPTRTFMPIIKDCILNGVKIEGIIHCSGGGLTKSQNFGNGIRYVKNDLLPTPPIFNEIQEARNIEDKYMYQTFNMGHGMEIIVPSLFDAEMIIDLAKKFNVEAKVIGYTEKCKQNEVVVEDRGKTLVYKK